MKILAIDSSGKTASAAILEDNVVLCEFFLNNGLTHSQTLAPMVDSLFKISGIKPEDLGLISVVTGPGSFTGLRIGAALAKGMALALDLPCVGVTSLEALAFPKFDFEGIVCSLIHAIADEYYVAFFENGEKITDETVMKTAELENEITARKTSFCACCDATLLKKFKKPVKIIDNNLNNLYNVYSEGGQVSAANVGKIAFKKFKNKFFCSAEELELLYIKEPKAVRDQKEC